MARPDPLASALVKAAFELHRRKLWLEVPRDTPFLLNVPGEQHPIVVLVMGHAGREYGLLLARGEFALSHTLRIVSGELQEPAERETLSMMSVSMAPLHEIPAELRSVLTAAGFQGRRENIAPYLVVKEPYGSPRAARKSEQRLMLACVHAVMETLDAGELRVEPLHAKRRRILEITVEGEGDSLRTTTRSTKLPAAAAVMESLGFAESEDSADTATPMETEWLVGVAAAPGVRLGDGTDLALLFVAQLDPREILSVQPVRADDASAVAAHLEALLEDGVPRRIVLADERLHTALAPDLIAKDIEVELDPWHPGLVELFELITPQLEENSDSAARLGPDAPMPSTLEEWKEADQAMADRLSEEGLAAGGLTTRMMERYFGGEEVTDEVIAELGDLGPIPCVQEWVYADYRKNARAATFLEKRLKKEMTTRVERVLIEARIESRLSIYRVVSTQPGESLDLEDVFDGEKVTVHDRALSGCDVERTFLPLRIKRLGDWSLATLAGPPIPSGGIGRALALLEELGAEMSAAGLRRSAHLMGSLWELALPRSQMPVLMTNTDGEELSFLTATFTVADVTALTRALGAREDLWFNESEGAWVWSRRGGPGGVGGDTQLARLEMMGDRLVVEVNSAERLTKARAWLEAVPGVLFERASARQMTEGGGPLDDVLPQRKQSVPPEALQMLEALNRKMSFDWLDTSIPALGGLTPRKACETKKGKQEVERMIRTMPDVVVPGGTWAPPREELLRELGLGTRRSSGR